MREDYLLSNQHRADEVEKRLIALRAQIANKQGIPTDRVDMTNIQAFYVQQGSYIDATRDAILSQFGSIEHYLTDGLGLRPAEIETLREKLLE